MASYLEMILAATFQKELYPKLNVTFLKNRKYYLINFDPLTPQNC